MKLMKKLRIQIIKKIIITIMKMKIKMNLIMMTLKRPLV